MFMRGPHDPIRIERATGPWLYTTDGHKILDAGAGAVVVNIGRDQVDRPRLNISRPDAFRIDASDRNRCWCYIFIGAFLPT